jgi:micrococcal nuclease
LRLCVRFLNKVDRIPLALIALITVLFATSAVAEQWVKVKWVDDGDTILLTNGRHLRYIGINSPEIENKKYERKAEPYGQKALRYNQHLVYKKRVRLEFDRDSKDRYGRLLAYVFLPNGTFVNLKMIEQGYAYCLYKRPNDRYQKKFLTAQREAMTAGRGIWQQWREPGRKYVGSRRSRRFHLETCPNGRKIKNKNRIFFSSRWEAFWTGYAPAKGCRP